MYIYKPGDKVRITKNKLYLGDDASEYGYNLGGVYGVREYTPSDQTVAVWNSDKTDYEWFSLSSIAPATPSWDTLSEGDVLVRDDLEYDKVVQGVIGKIVFTIDTDGDSSSSSIDELKNGGWKIKDAESDDITEVTLEQVADKLGISVEKLRIKD